MNDIVCGKEVAASTLFKTVHGDRPFYFCSRSCEMEFVKDPLKYIEKTGDVASTVGSPKKSASGENETSRS